jgi:hypothetical protein
MAEICLHSPVCIQGVVLNGLGLEITLTFREPIFENKMTEEQIFSEWTYLEPLCQVVISVTHHHALTCAAGPTCLHFSQVLR